MQPQERYLKSILSASTDLIFLLDRDRRILYANAAAATAFGLTADAMIGKTSQEIGQSITVISQLDSELERVFRTGAQFQGNIRYPSRSGTRDYEYVLSPLTDDAGVIDAVLHRASDVHERNHVLEILERERGQLQAIQDSMTEGLVIGDLAGKVIAMNPAALTLLGFKSFSNSYTEAFDITTLDGQPVSTQDLPIARVTRGEHFVDSVLVLRRRDTGVKICVSHTGTQILDQSGQPILGLITIRDVTKFIEVEQRFTSSYERERLINEIGNAIRDSEDPSAIQQTASQALGAALHVDRCYFNFFDAPQDVTWIENDWHAPELVSIAGKYRLSDVRSHFLEELFGQGATVCIADIQNSFLSESAAGALVQSGYRAMLTTPFYTDGELTAVLVVAMSSGPRNWTQDEVTLVAAVAAQTRSAVDAALLLTQTKGRAEREALLNRIGAAIRQCSDPESVRQEAVSILGRELKCDRCYFAIGMNSNSRFALSGEYFQSDLGTLSSVVTASQLRTLVEEICVLGTTCTLSETSMAILTDLNQGSFVAVPMIDGERSLGALFAAMTDTNRQWSVEELSLIETVAAMTRTAEKAAENHQRQRLIATQLQQSLQPELPCAMPGLALGDYYRPALDEAEVGGDFADCFAMDADITYLVVGDLSGKGLAAAAQVATVRNMLRFAVYNNASLVDAVSQLNHTLSSFNLLNGFSTLFIGRYDGRTGELTYVNCGQEPGLVARAQGCLVERLEPTGPILGTFMRAAFEECTIILQTGDTLALFTDGLTEVGPNRKQLLGVSGIADFLMSQACQCPAPDDQASLIVSHLIAEVSRFAEGSLRDDVCLMVAVATPTQVTGA